MTDDGALYESRVTSHASRVLRWFRAVRPYAYPASIMPALLGTVLAWAQGYPFHLDRALLVLVGVIAAHTGGNLINDYEDVRRGVDRPGTQGGNGLLVTGQMTMRETLVGAGVALTIAFACGVPLIIAVGWPIAALMILGALAAFGYGFPPLSLKYRALGDVTVFFTFGIGITLGAYLVQAEAFSWTAIVAAIPLGLFVAAILIMNNLRDIEDDRAAGVTTFEGRLGLRAGAHFFILILSAAYVMTVMAVIGGSLPWGSLAMLGTIPLAIALVLQARAARVVGPSALTGAPEETAKLMFLFGLLLVLGVAVSAVLSGRSL